MPNYADFLPVDSLPAADATWYGRTVLLQVPATADRAYVCRKQSDGSYFWYSIMDTIGWASSSGANPTGAAGGELGGTYPNPTVVASHSGSAHHTAFIQADHDALANPHHSNANDHASTNDPTAGQKAALPGTSGTPGDTNRYVTDGDARNTNARTPSSTLAHKTSHEDAGSDEISVLGLSGLLADGQTPLAHNILTLHNGFPGGTANFLRADGAFAAPTVLAEFHIPLMELATEMVF